jgi:hypothetical protein
LKEISRLSDPALTDPAARIQRDQRQSDVNVVEAELQHVRSELEKAARTGPSATELFFQSAGYGNAADVIPWWPGMSEKGR